jgi:hypothetical protein
MSERVSTRVGYSRSTSSVSLDGYRKIFMNGSVDLPAESNLLSLKSVYTDEIPTLVTFVGSGDIPMAHAVVFIEILSKNIVVVFSYLGSKCALVVDNVLVKGWSKLPGFGLTLF